jgi:hypothetical protein
VEIISIIIQIVNELEIVTVYVLVRGRIFIALAIKWNCSHLSEIINNNSTILKIGVSKFMKRHIYRVVTRGPEGDYRIRDYMSEEEIRHRHIQIGTDDCSTDMSLRGRPVFKGLIGPMPETGGVVRYESPDVFEQMTKEWSELKRKRRRTQKPVIVEFQKQPEFQNQFDLGAVR